MKVSIIMPTYNGSLLISDSIYSVLNQSYPDFELIIIDDTSTDNTLDIINKFNDNRIKVLSNKYYKGAAGARETGLKYSTGDYICFLDSDDIWGADKLKNQLSFMLKNDIDFSYTDYFSFHKDIKNIYKKHKSPDKVNYKLLLRCCNIGCLTVMIRSCKIKELSISNVPKEDYAFWLKVLRNVDYAYRAPFCNSFYRLHPNSLSSNKVKEIKKQWHIINKVENQSSIKSIYYILYYVFNGLKKHYKVL